MTNVFSTQSSKFQGTLLDWNGIVLGNIRNKNEWET